MIQEVFDMKIVHIIQLNLCVFVFLMSSISFAELQHHQINQIKETIELLKTGNKYKIAYLFKYPIKMKFPNPDIYSEDEFLQRYDEVLDNEILNKLTSSKISEHWKSSADGLMFNNGVVWITYDGLVFSYTTELHIKKLNKIISEQKRNIHPSLREFNQPVLERKFGKFFIRIDLVDESNYRYASWSNTENTKKKPDLVLGKGVKWYDGMGGNYTYSFKSGEYKYRVIHNRVGSGDTPPWQLEVLRNNRVILSAE